MLIEVRIQAVINVFLNDRVMRVFL